MTDQEIKAEFDRFTAEVKACGANVRAANKAMMENGRAIAGRIREENEQKRNAYIREVESFVASVASDKSTPPEDLALSFMMKMQGLKTLTQTQETELNAFRANPPGKDHVDTAIGAFNAKLDEFRQFAGAHGLKVPWMLAYCADMDPDAPPSEQVVELGGTIIDPKTGRSIWESSCYLCALVIQDGAHGEGTPRWHCMDQGKIDLCTSCKGMRDTLIEGIEKRGQDSKDALLQELSIQDPLSSGWFVSETTHPVFLRLPARGEGAKTLKMGLQNVMKSYAQRPCFGVWNNERGSDYTWMSYAEVNHHSLTLSHFLSSKLSNSDRKQNPKNGFVAICSENRPEWLFADFACVFGDFLSVGIHVSWPVDEVVYVLNQTEARAVVCGGELIPKFLEAMKSCPNLEIIVSMDPLPAQPLDPSIQSKLFSMCDFMTATTGEPNLSAEKQPLAETVPSSAPAASGSEQPVEEEPKLDLYTVMYSSGTSGAPKGIEVTESRWLKDSFVTQDIEPFVVMSYSALAHGMDRGIVWLAVANGGRVGFAQTHNVEFIIEATSLLQPTLFVAMPYFWNHLFAKFNAAISQSQSQPSPQPTLNDSQLWFTDASDPKREWFKKALGKRLNHVSTGGGPISDEVLTFLREASELPVPNMYGATEAPGITQDGLPLPNVDVKLVDLPDSGYLTSDTPYPRGEIWTKTPSMATSYFKDPERSKLAWVQDDEGLWYKTGDVGQWVTEIDSQGKPVKRLEIIDRVAGLIELYVSGRSAWIASHKAEAQLCTAKGVRQICLHGDRMQGSVLAIVVPQSKFVQSFARRNGLSAESVSKHPGFASLLLQNIQKTASEAGFLAHEIPVGVLVDCEPWTTTNGLATSTGKLCRSRIIKMHKLQLDMIYDKITEGN